MAFAVIATVVLLLAAYIAIVWALEKAGWIKLDAPKGGWPRRAHRDGAARRDDAPRPHHGRGGDFGGGGATGDW